MDNLNPDYYIILDLTRHASKAEVRKAYLKRSLLYHPDKNNGLYTDKFRQVKDAYDILVDTAKRQAYDLKFGSSPRGNGSSAGGSQNSQNSSSQGTQQQRWAREQETQRKQEAEREAELKAKKAQDWARREQEAEERSRLAAKRAREAQECAAKKRLDAQRAEEAEQRSATADADAALRAQLAQKLAASERKLAERLLAQEKLLDQLEQAFERLSAGTNYRQSRQSQSKSQSDWRQPAACNHKPWWPQVYGASTCDFCQKSFPIYTLQCPLCDAKACIPCKIRESGR